MINGRNDITEVVRDMSYKHRLAVTEFWLSQLEGARRVTFLCLDLQKASADRVLPKDFDIQATIKVIRRFTSAVTGKYWMSAADDEGPTDLRMTLLRMLIVLFDPRDHEWSEFHEQF